MIIHIFYLRQVMFDLLSVGFQGNGHECTFHVVFSAADVRRRTAHGIVPGPHSDSRVVC